MAEPTAPRVGIVLLNWNSFDDTAACLSSLAALDYPSYEVVVVDNGSADGSVAALRARFPDLQEAGPTAAAAGGRRWLLLAGRNLGFAGGCNLGIRWALAQGCDYVMLLNNDTEVAPDFVRRLVAEAEADPGVGLVGPRILDPRGRIWFDGGRRQRWTLAAVATGRGRQVAGAPATPRDVDCLVGCALLVKRAVWERVGLLDTASFMYAEDDDFCLRAAAAGYRLRQVPGAMVVHKVAASTRGRRPLLRYYRARGRAWLLRKHSRDGLAPALAVAYLLATGVWGLAVELAAADLPSARAFLRGVLDGWLGRNKGSEVGP